VFHDSLPLVVVGAVDIFGTRTVYSQGVAAELDSSAVGDVVCPNGEGEGLQLLSGTSLGMT
jgi:hypothetical protein